jgi:hypothetical protein
MKQLSENFDQLSRAQFQFDRWLELVEEAQVYEAGRNSNFPLHPNHYWTHLAGRQVVDFVGRVERFEADFEALLSRFRIEPVERVNANVVELEGSAGANPHGYRYVDRMNACSIEKINRLFALDFELFGYPRLEPMRMPVARPAGAVPRETIEVG